MQPPVVFDTSLFVLRRACWLGSCSRAAVMSTIGASASGASLILSRAVNAWPDVLVPRPRFGVERDRSAQIPLEASAETMFKILESGAPAQILGGTPEEFGMSPTPPLVPSRPGGGLDIILEATAMCRQQQWVALEILYCGLKRKASAKWRLVIPNGLEYNGNQWRLLAIDIGDSKDFKMSQRTFVFSRIMQTKIATWPRGLRKDKLFWASQGKVKRRVILNTELTHDQKSVISKELGIQHGQIELYGRGEFEFRRLYTTDNALIANDIVWPIIKSME